VSGLRAASWHFISTYYRRCTVKTTSNLFNVYNPVALSPAPLLKDKLLTCLVASFKKYREAATRLTFQQR
jgi:hypothetical protein